MLVFTYNVEYRYLWLNISIAPGKSLATLEHYFAVLEDLCTYLIRICRNYISLSNISLSE